jgi:hypothetical protein
MADAHLEVRSAKGKEVDRQLDREGLRSLRIEHCRLGKGALGRIATLASLESLEILTSGLNAKALTSLLERASWPSLRRLDLRGNALGDDGLSALGKATAALPALSDLGLFATRMREPGIRALAAHRGIEKWQSGSDAIGVAGVCAIAENDWPLTRLSIVRQQGGAQGIDALMARAPSTLRSLVLFEAGMGKKAIDTIASTDRFTLEEARFRYDPITDDAVAALAQAGCTRGLRALQISQARVGAGGVKAIARSHLPETLEELHLSTNPGIGVDGVDCLIYAKWPKLRALRIGGTDLGAFGLDALLANDLPSLEELDLTNGQIEDVAMGRLASWPGLARVRRLFIGTNRFTADGLARLSSSPFAAGIEELDVSQCPCSATAAEVVAQGSQLAPKTLHTSYVVRG